MNDPLGLFSCLMYLSAVSHTEFASPLITKGPLEGVTSTALMILSHIAVISPIAVLKRLATPSYVEHLLSLPSSIASLNQASFSEA